MFENSTLPEIRELFNATDMGILQKLFSWNLVFGRAGSGASSCEYGNDPKFWDRLVWANSADPDQTPPRGAV